jgi:hypothetical protein
MGENEKWRMDYGSCPDLNKGLSGETIVHVILALCVLSLAYTFFAKTELESKSNNLPEINTKPVEVRDSDPLV